MIDKSIKHYSLTMYHQNAEDHPSYDLPEGYEFVFYQKGDEQHWAEIETDVGQFSSIQSALDCFKREFIDGHSLSPKERMIFVRDKSGEYVATGTLWNGMFLRVEQQRIHWIAVKDAHAGKGIAKALLSRLFCLYHELGYEGFLYLLTGTRNYRAVGMYRKFGFREYRGPRSLSKDLSDEAFIKQTEEAILLIDRNLARDKAART